MKFNSLNLVTFLGFFLLGDSQIISQISLFNTGSLFNTDRDGFLLATLNTGEQTSICNYKFTEADANVACLTLGYPAQGLSIVNPNSSIAGSVLIGDMSCTGTETNINLCLNSGRKIFSTPCSKHTMDTYIYCLQPKNTPVIVPTVVNTNCNTSNGNYNFKLLNGTFNSGFLTIGSKYVCNNDFSITPTTANLLCQRFCSGVSNPLPRLFIPGGVPQGSSYITINAAGDKVKDNVACTPAYALALRCGNEPTTIELSPNVTCNSQNITATWIAGFSPPINTSLLSTPMSCSFYNISDTTYDALLSFSYQSCNPIVTADANSITYSYWITRKYLSTGITSLSPRNMTISCTFPKSNIGNQNISFQTPTIPPLGAFTIIRASMIFYSDASFQTIMPLPYTILDNQLMYVKVRLESSLSSLKLGLVNCKVSTSDSMANTNPNNSIALIIDSCPASNVAIYPLNSKEIGFQFQPAKINNNNTVFVLCDTTKCYIDASSVDSNCIICQNVNRRKRSAILTEEIVLGPLFVHNQD